MAKCFRINDFSEVGVLGQQDPLFVACKPQHFFVGDTWRNLGNSQDVVSRRAKRSYDCEVAALIGDESHCSGFHVRPGSRQKDNFLVRDRFSRIGDCCPDILAREARIRIEQVVFRSTLSELPQDQFHLDPRPSNDRFPHHHVRIDFYAISGHASILVIIQSDGRYGQR